MSVEIKERTSFPTVYWTIPFNSIAASTFLIPLTYSEGLTPKDPDVQSHAGLGYRSVLPNSCLCLGAQDHFLAWYLSLRA